MASDLRGFQQYGGPCAAYAYMAAAQTTNLAVGDHAKLDTLAVAPADTRIAMDVSSAYTNGAGRSLGRFSLQPGFVYDLHFEICHAGFANTSGFLSAAFYDTITGVYISPSTIYRAVGSSNLSGSSSAVRALYAPVRNNLIEVRFRDAADVSQLGFNSGADVFLPFLVIKTI